MTRAVCNGVKCSPALVWPAVLPALLLSITAAASAAGDDALPPPPLDSGGEAARAPAPARKTIAGGCENCGVVRSIRQVERERPTPTIQSYIASPQYLDTRNYSEPRVGPLLGYSFGPGSTGRGYVGAAGGPEMQRRLKQISYEVILRFEDGRYGLYEQDDVSYLRVGDRVKVTDNRVVPAN